MFAMEPYRCPVNERPKKERKGKEGEEGEGEGEEEDEEEMLETMT